MVLAEAKGGLDEAESDSKPSTAVKDSWDPGGGGLEQVAQQD